MNFVQFERGQRLPFALATPSPYVHVTNPLIILYKASPKPLTPHLF